MLSLLRANFFDLILDLVAGHDAVGLTAHDLNRDLRKPDNQQQH